MLGDYLRARRELVHPDTVGLPAGGMRRVAGLRREEVAMLAGISSDYYLRLEQGRDRNPSTGVLEALARVLRLDQAATDYLLSLAAPRPAIGAAAPSARPCPPSWPCRALSSASILTFAPPPASPGPCRPTRRRGRTDFTRYFSIPPSRRCTRTGTRPPPGWWPASGSPSEPTPTTPASSSSSANCPCPAKDSGSCGPGTTFRPARACRPSSVPPRSGTSPSAARSSPSAVPTVSCSSSTTPNPGRVALRSLVSSGHWPARPPRPPATRSRRARPRRDPAVPDT